MLKELKNNYIINFMPARKGQVCNPNGRPKGSVNKSTLEFKQAVNNLIAFATPQMVAWLSEIEDPSKRLEHIYKFAQFGYPLLSRTTYEGDDKKPLVNKVTIEVIKSEASSS